MYSFKDCLQRRSFWCTIILLPRIAPVSLMMAYNMAVYYLKLTFLNQVIAPITTLLLPLTLCVQGSATKLFKPIAVTPVNLYWSWSRHFFDKWQGYPFLVLPSKHFCRTKFASFEWEEGPTELLLQMWFLNPLELSRWWYIRFDWEFVIVAAVPCWLWLCWKNGEKNVKSLVCISL